MPATTRARLITAAAAVTALAVLAVVLLTGRGSTPVDGTAAAADPAATAATPGGAGAVGEAPAGPADGSGVDDPGDGAPPVDGAATPVDAVRGFVSSLDAGNDENAYALMHPRYRDDWPFYGEFAADPGPAAEFAPFAALGPGAYQTAAFTQKVQGEAVALVSVYGEVTENGQPATLALAVPVRQAASGWLVDAGDGDGGSVFQNPAPAGEQIQAGSDLVVWTPSAGLGEVLAVVDGEPRPTSVQELDDPGETAEIRVDDYSPGVQQAAVGVLREDGSVDAVATFFTA